MIGRRMRITLAGVICILLLGTLTGCQQVKDLLTPPELFVQEKAPDQTRKEYEEAFAAGVEAYEKGHPADLCRPADEHVTLCPVNTVETQIPFARQRYAVQSAGIAFGTPVYDVESGEIRLAVVGLNAEKETWMRENICTDPLFSASKFIMITEENEPYQRNLSGPAKDFYARLRTYEEKHPGSVEVSWTRVSLRPGAEGAERRIDLVPVAGGGGGTILTCTQPLTEAGRTWAADTFFGGEFPEWVTVPDAGKLREDAAPENFAKSRYEEEPEGISSVKLVAAEPKIRKDATRVEWRIENEGNRMVFADRAPVLEMKNGEDWVQVPSQYENHILPGSVPGQIGVTVQPDESARFALDLEMYVPLEAGTYRIVQKIGAAPDTAGVSTVGIFTFEIQG